MEVIDWKDRYDPYEVTMAQASIMDELQGEFEAALESFATPGARFDNIPLLTRLAVRLGISEEDLLDMADEATAGTVRDWKMLAERISHNWTNTTAEPFLGWPDEDEEERAERLARAAERKQAEAGERFDALPDLVPDAIGGKTLDYEELLRLSPTNLRRVKCETEADGRKITRGYVAALYAEGDYLDFARLVKHEGEHEFRDLMLLPFASVKSAIMGDRNTIMRNPLDGSWHESGKGKKSPRTKRSIATFRYALVEFDHLPIGEQAAFWARYVQDEALRSTCGGWPLVSIVHSGDRSLHALLRVDAADVDGPGEKTVENRLAASFCASADERFKADPRGFAAFGRTRIPGVRRWDAGGAWQRLLYLDRKAASNPMRTPGAKTITRAEAIMRLAHLGQSNGRKA